MRKSARVVKPSASALEIQWSCEAVALSLRFGGPPEITRRDDYERRDRHRGLIRETMSGTPGPG
jgi:hypothetical protein